MDGNTNAIIHTPIAILSNSQTTSSGSTFIIGVSKAYDIDNLVTISSNDVIFNETGIYLIMFNFNAGEYGSSYYGEAGIYDSSNNRLAFTGDDGCVWNHSFQLAFASTFMKNSWITFRFYANSGVQLRQAYNSINIIKMRSL